MKRLLLTTLAIAAVTSLTAGCDRDDDNIRVDRAMEQALRTRYPNIGRVRWEMNDGYFVADFRRSGADAEAWFDPACKWWMTETDIRYRDLPEAVKTAFRQSEYGSWRIDDIDMLEYPDRETVYIIEVERGHEERDLYFTPDGVLAKIHPEKPGQTPPTDTPPTTTPPPTPPTGDQDNGGGGNHSGGHHQPSVLPDAVREFIATKYPDARIVDVDRERNSIEVDIVDGRTPREVTFTTAGEWIRTETEIRRTEIPAVVRDAIAATQYASWRVDDVDHYDTPEGEYYIVELESGHNEVRLRIGPDGTMQ